MEKLLKVAVWMQPQAAANERLDVNQKSSAERRQCATETALYVQSFEDCAQYY